MWPVVLRGETATRTAGAGAPSGRSLLGGVTHDDTRFAVVGHTANRAGRRRGGITSGPRGGSR